MRMVRPAAPRATITETPEGLRVVIPTQRNWFLLVFLTLWLAIWLGAGPLVFASLLASLGRQPPGEMLFRAVWLCGWAAGALWAGYTWLRTVVGREVIEVSGAALVVRQEVWRIRLARAFDMHLLRNLRVAPVPDSPWGGGAWQWQMQFGQVGGTVAFDYGARTYRFGRGIDEAEAKHVVAAILQRFPLLGADGRGT
jgi:hypothetical protein